MRTYLFRSIALMCLLISVSCSKSDDNENNQNENDQIDNNQNDNGQPTPEDLTIVTIEPFDIKPFNATTGGDIMNDSEVILIERGIVWADSPSPTDNDNVIVDQTGLGEGTYTTGFECLDVASTFYVRAYARSSDAIYYGNEISFSTLSHNTFLGDIMLNNQEEVDAFGASDYSRIDGSLQVNGFMNMNLTSLKGLSEVTGSLVIGVSPGQILELNGLNCLKEVGERLELRGLDSFDELFNLERIGGNFMLTNVDQGDLRGFDKLTYIGARFSFVGGDITELVGLNNVTDLGSDLDAADSSLVIEIRDSNLNTINLFNSVNTDIPGIDIRNNTNLTNIDGFNILTNVEAINISGNVSNSITISGFNSLEEVDELRIFSNRTNLFSGFNTITAINQFFDITVEDDINFEFEGLNDLTSIGNDSDPGATRTVHLAGLGFNRLEGLDNLETITGNVELDGLNNIGNNISFNSLTTINGNLRILCPGWSDMTLFSSLTTVTGEIQLRCFAGGPWRYTLTSLNGIENLTNVGGDFKIAENQNLTDFCGVFNLLSTGYELSSTAQAFGPGNGYNPTFEQILNGECAL